MARITSRGLKLEYSQDGIAFTQVAYVRAAGFPTPQTSEIDQTHLESAAFDTTPGLPDYGTVEFEFLTDFKDPDQYPALATFSQDGTLLTWRLTFSDATIITWPGYVADLPGSAGLNEMVTNTLRVRSTGLATLT